MAKHRPHFPDSPLDYFAECLWLPVFIALGALFENEFKAYAFYCENH